MLRRIYRRTEIEMGLQIITADLSIDNKSRIIQHLIHLMETNPKAIIYYIVPDHLKFDMEKFVLEHIQAHYGAKQSAMVNLQVVSFSRLSWYLIQPQRVNQLSLSDVGLSMIIKQILMEKAEDLIVFRSQINHQGFIDRLLDLFNELIEGNVQPEDLMRYSEAMNDNAFDGQAIYNIEKQKNTEIFILYQAFVQSIQDYNITQYDTLSYLESYITDGEDLTDYYMVIDHYHYFNAQQMSLLLTLAKKANTLYITLPLSHADAIGQKRQPLLDLVRYTYQQIKSLARLQDIKVLADWDITQPAIDIHPDLLATARLFKDLQEIGMTLSENKVNYLSPPLEIWQTDTIQTELRHVSNQIKYLINEKDYRYNDIIIMTRDISRYQSIIEPYFEANDIPVFVDNLAKMSDHPFVILLKSILNLKLYRYKYDDIMLVLKSNLIFPEFIEDFTVESSYQEKRQQINYFENIILANGYVGYRFYSKDYHWHFDQEDKVYESQFADIPNYTMKDLATNWRTWLLSKTHKSFKAWNKSMTGKQASNWLYDLIVDLGIKDEFIRMRDKAIQVGDIEKSRRDEQVWQVFANLLEEFHTIYEDEIIDFDFFVELMITGLSNSTYHIIPTTLDQVTFTSLESPQVGPYKVAFAIGMDEKSLPSTHQESSLMDQTTREGLQEYLLSHQYLMNRDEQQYSRELLLTYQLLLKASDLIYVSFASNVNNVSVRISPYIQQLISLLKLPIYSFTHNLINDLKSMHPSTFGSYSMEQNLVLQMIHQVHKNGSYLNDIQQQFLLAMKEYDQGAQHHYQSLRLLIQAVTEFDQLPDNISAEVALELFGKDMNVSVSKIEQYYQDPFSHFLVHGLKLQERQLFELDYARSGDYFHEFLDRFTRRLIDFNLNLSTLSLDELNYQFNLVSHEIDQDNRFNIMSSHAKFWAIKGQMDRRLLEFVQFSKKQLERTQMITKQSEAIFGINPSREMLSGFVYPLRSGGKLSISGKIDRIDVATTANQSYLQIIDYKSGKKNFDIVDAYYGLDLQVLTYLSVALKNYPDSSPLGAFYQPLLHSYLDIKDKQLIRSTHLEDSERVNRLQLIHNKLNGFVSLSEDELAYIDGSIEEMKESLIYPIKLKKDGSYMLSSRVYSKEELNIMLEYVHLKFQQAANAIQAGNIVLSPYKENQFTTSLQSDYRVISGFDATENYQAYRTKSINRKKVIQQMALELEEGSDLEDDQEL